MSQRRALISRASRQRAHKQRSRKICSRHLHGGARPPPADGIRPLIRQRK